MQPSVFDNTLNSFMARRPYRPFTVVLVTGEQFEVDHPRSLVNRDGVAVYVRPGGVPVIFDYEGVSNFVGDLKDQPADPAA